MPHDREQALKMREDAVAAYERTFLQDAINKLDALTHRIAAIEAERAKDPDDDVLPLPPGSPCPMTAS
jgi:hypothetical protein